MGVYPDDVIVVFLETAYLRYFCPQKGAKDGNPKALSLFFYVANEGQEKLDLRYEQGNPFMVVGRTQVLGDFAVTVSDIEGCVAPSAYSWGRFLLQWPCNAGLDCQFFVCCGPEVFGMKTVQCFLHAWHSHWLRCLIMAH
jgi:hypothetical protein